MKKFLALMLVLAMVFALAACGAKNDAKADEEKPEANSESEAAPEAPVGVANPWVECSLDDIEAYIGWRFGIPDGATEAVFCWNESIGLAEMNYTVDGTEWCARIQKTDEFTDISGMYYDFDSDAAIHDYGDEIPLDDYAGDQYMGKMYLLETEEGTVNLAMWYYEKEGLMFSLGCVSPEGILLFADRTTVFFPEGCNTYTEAVENDPEAVAKA